MFFFSVRYCMWHLVRIELIYFLHFESMRIPWTSYSHRCSMLVNFQWIYQMGYHSCWWCCYCAYKIPFDIVYMLENDKKNDTRLRVLLNSTYKIVLSDWISINWITAYITVTNKKITRTQPIPTDFSFMNDSFAILIHFCIILKKSVH